MEKKIEAPEAADEASVANGVTRSQIDSRGVDLSKHSSTPNRVALRSDSDIEDGKDVRAEFPLLEFYNCKSLEIGYANLRERVSRQGNVLPQTLPGGARVDLESSRLFATRGRKAKMALALQVVSSHLLGVLDITSAISNQPALIDRLLPHAASEADALRRANSPRLFLLDGCSLTLPLGPLSGRLRANSPGSKFLALLAPDRNGEAEMIRLFHWGIDGMLLLHKDWKSELPKAVLALLGDRVWVPPAILLAFVKQMKTLLDRQLLPGQSLTARESQVLQLLFRRLTNKEIGCDLKISERTAKFHVCNVLNKLGLENRKNLLENFGLEIV